MGLAISGFGPGMHDSRCERLRPKGPIGASAIKLGSSVPEDLDKRIDEAIAESDREESENDSDAG